MSGGSFDYLYYKEEASEITDYNALHNLNKMIESMRNHDKNDAADEVEKLKLDVEMFKRMIENRMKRLSGVLYAYEWWMSCDTSEEDFDKEWEEFLEGKK